MKHWSMIKMNYLLVVITYAVCAIFYYKTLDIVAPADVYPRMLLLFMFILATLLLIFTVRVSRLVKENEDKVKEIEYPWANINNKRVWVAILVTAAYLVCMVFIGFYVTTFLYMVALMFWYSDNHDAKTFLQIVLASAVITVIVYVAFWTFLQVPTPTGLLL
jgi:putative tricarboxylic transport membrane protein